MKLHRITISFLVFTIFLGFTHTNYAAQPPKSEQKTLAHALIDDKMQPTRPLLGLLATLGLKHDGSIESIKNITQKTLLRPATLEREESPEMYPEKREALLPFFKELGLVDDVHPTKKHYNHVIVYSNGLASMRRRFAFASALWQRGVRFGNLHLVGSERKRHPQLESQEILTDPNNPDLPLREDWEFDGELPSTETPMMKFIYDQAKLAPGFKEIPVEVLNIPNHKKPDGSETRANTRTQVVTWCDLHKNPNDSTIQTVLSISDNPYIAYQDSVAKTYADPAFDFETAGPRADTNQSNFNLMCLDTVARIIYQELERRKNMQTQS